MKPISVLLVDNNSIFLRILSRYLDSCPEEITVIGQAHSGTEALAQAQALQPQLILLDLVLPDYSGLELIGYLRRLVPEVFIVALTSYNIDSYRQAALAAGAHDFVPKATLSAELLPAIRRLFHPTPLKTQEKKS